jgi:hypothetical protein
MGPHTLVIVVVICFLAISTRSVVCQMRIQTTLTLPTPKKHSFFLQDLSLQIDQPGLLPYSLCGEGALELVQGRGVRGGGLPHRRQDLVERRRRHLQFVLRRKRRSQANSFSELGVDVENVRGRDGSPKASI